VTGLALGARAKPVDLSVQMYLGWWLEASRPHGVD
jgi:hypothetical protein